MVISNFRIKNTRIKNYLPAEFIDINPYIH